MIIVSLRIAISKSLNDAARCFLIVILQIIISKLGNYCHTKRYAKATSLRLKSVKMKYVINKTQYSHSRMDIMNIVWEKSKNASEGGKIDRSLVSEQKDRLWYTRTVIGTDVISVTQFMLVSWRTSRFIDVLFSFSSFNSLFFTPYISFYESLIVH